MVKKKGETILNAQKIKPELKALKEKKKTIDQKIKPKKHPKKETKIKKKIWDIFCTVKLVAIEKC